MSSENPKDRVFVGWWCVHGNVTKDPPYFKPFGDGAPHECTMVFPKHWKDDPRYQKLYLDGKRMWEEHSAQFGCKHEFVERSIMAPALDTETPEWARPKQIEIPHLSESVPVIHVWTGKTHLPDVEFTVDV